MTYDEAMQIALLEHSNGGTRLVERIAELLIAAYRRGLLDGHTTIQQEASKPEPEPLRRVYGVALSTHGRWGRERVMWGSALLGNVAALALEQQQYWEYHMAVPARVVWVDYRRPNDLPSVIYPSESATTLPRKPISDE